MCQKYNLAGDTPLYSNAFPKNQLFDVDRQNPRCQTKKKWLSSIVRLN